MLGPMGSSETERTNDLLPASLEDRLLFLVKRIQSALAAQIDEALDPLGIDARIHAPDAGELGGAQSQQAMGQRLRVDRTSMVALVDALARKGLVTRRGDPSDRRANLVEISHLGRRALERALRVVEVEEQRVLSGLPSDDVRHLKVMLRVWAARSANRSR